MRAADGSGTRSRERLRERKLMTFCLHGVLFMDAAGGVVARLAGASVLIVLAVICFWLSRRSKSSPPAFIAAGLISCAVAIFLAVEAVRNRDAEGPNDLLS